MRGAPSRELKQKVNGVLLVRDGLRSLAAEWQVPCGAEAVEQVARYVSLLLSWNQRINLTAADSAETLVAEHLPDAFALASALDGTERVADVGSGGGLPAVPLAILRPHLTIMMIEPIAKKVAFLRTAVRELGLGARVRVEARRAEAVVAEAPESFDAAVARAVLAPAAWEELGRHLVRPGGRIFVLAAGKRPELAGEVSLDRPYLRGRRRLVAVTRGP
jgi:16S rRNA (guanine527-N7)-methyltransferase